MAQLPGPAGEGDVLSDGQEREIKLILADEGEYQRLADHLTSCVAVREQHNSYWDLPDRPLAGRGILLRLRLEGSQAWVTVKERGTRDDNGVFVAREVEEAMAAGVAASVVAGQQRLEEVLPVDVRRFLEAAVGKIHCLEQWGQLENRRRSYALDDQHTLELDRTVFGGDQVEFEVEVECAEESSAEERLRALLQAVGIPWRPQTVTKSERLKLFLGLER